MSRLISINLEIYILRKPWYRIKLIHEFMLRNIMESLYAYKKSLIFPILKFLANKIFSLSQKNYSVFNSKFKI